jgi:hypothetical protein
MDFDTGMDTDKPFFDGREMHMIHDMLRREFGLMPGLVRGVADGDERRAKIIDLTVAQLPAEAQPVIRQLATQAFVAHSQLVHGTTAPPRSTDL